MFVYSTKIPSVIYPFYNLNQLTDHKIVYTFQLFYMYKKQQKKKRRKLYTKTTGICVYTFSLTHYMLFGNVVNKSSKLNNTTIQLYSF